MPRIPQHLTHQLHAEQGASSAWDTSEAQALGHRHPLCLLSSHLPYGLGKVLQMHQNCSHSFISRLHCRASHSAQAGCLGQLLLLQILAEGMPAEAVTLSLSCVSSPSKPSLAVCVAEPKSLAKSYDHHHLVHLLLSHPSQECSPSYSTEQREK